MARHFACMTFDFDAMSGLVARRLVTPTAISRGEFGVIGVRRILTLLKKYEIPATFYVPGVVIGTYPHVCEEIVAAGHEIGHHGWTHVPPAKLQADEEIGLVRGIEAIKRLTGVEPRGYRSPSWDLSPVTAELLLRHGFLYDSSMMGNDHSPYRVRVGDRIELEEPVIFGRETKLVEMPISWSLDDFVHFEYVKTETAVMPGLMNANGVLDNWTKDFEYMARTTERGVLTYTCHPYVIGRGHRMLILERLLLNLIERNAKFLRVEDAAREYLSSPDEFKLHSSSAGTVWSNVLRLGYASLTNTPWPAVTNIENSPSARPNIRCPWSLFTPFYLIFHIHAFLQSIKVYFLKTTAMKENLLPI